MMTRTMSRTMAAHTAVDGWIYIDYDDSDWRSDDRPMHPEAKQKPDSKTARVRNSAPAIADSLCESLRSSPGCASIHPAPPNLAMER